MLKMYFTWPILGTHAHQSSFLETSHRLAALQTVLALTYSACTFVEPPSFLLSFSLLVTFLQPKKRAQF